MRKLCWHALLVGLIALVPNGLFAQSTGGAWIFDTPELLEAGNAREYIVGVPVEGDGAVNIDAFNWSVYAQDEWTVSDNFNMNLGVRVEAPTFRDKPPYNPAIEAAERAVACGYPKGAGAGLVVELDGAALEVEHEYAEVERLCREAGTFEFRMAIDAAERADIWKGRKSAFAAVGRISPDYIVQDGVVPRTAAHGVIVNAITNEKSIAAVAPIGIGRM